MEKLVPIIDAGHGYMIDGVYQTAGKRSPFSYAGKLCEGVSNRHFVNDLCKLLVKNNIPFYLLNPENRDVSLGARVRRANKVYSTNKNAYVLSLHSNAGGGTGYETFTSVGQTKSDLIGELFAQKLVAEFPEDKHRLDCTDGDSDKEKNFFILKNTNCPAVLLELLFMDSNSDYEKLMNDSYRYRIVHALFEVVYRLYHYGV